MKLYNLEYKLACWTPCCRCVWSSRFF